MKISVVFSDQPSDNQTLKVLKKIGQGKVSVYHACSTSSKANYALKAFPKNSSATFQYKRESLVCSLSHPNVIQHFPIISCDDNQFDIILTELAQYGDFFELVVGGLLNTETLVRSYFHQLIEGLEYIHSQGLAHLDLKLENLVMGSDFTLKIIDFDVSQRITDKKIDSAGTLGFRAPEVIDGTCRNLSAADVYSAGIILFAFKAREYPFEEIAAEKNNGIPSLRYYPLFLRDNDNFWDIKADVKKDTSFFSKDFKELVNGMLAYDPEKRFSFKQIKESKWYKGPVLSGKELKAEVEARLKVLMN